MKTPSKTLASTNIVCIELLNKFQFIRHIGTVEVHGSKLEIKLDKYYRNPLFGFIAIGKLRWIERRFLCTVEHCIDGVMRFDYIKAETNSFKIVNLTIDNDQTMYTRTKEKKRLW